MYHLGLWFNSPKDAVAAHCAGATTPFNGEHNAGVQVLSTRNFPDQAVGCATSDPDHRQAHPGGGSSAAPSTVAPAYRRPANRGRSGGAAGHDHVLQRLAGHEPLDLLGDEPRGQRVERVGAAGHVRGDEHTRAGPERMIFR